MLYEEIQIKYINPKLGIAVQDIRNVWLLHPVPVLLTSTIHRGALTFRIPCTGKRISYQTLKKGLIKKQLIIRKPYQLLPF